MITDPQPNTYQAFILRFCDGDTLIVLLQARFGCWSEKRLRLAGIESYELDGDRRKDAEAIRDRLDRELADTRCRVHLPSHKHDRYGRLCGSVQVNGTDLAEYIVRNGWGWPCTKEESTKAHAATTPATTALVATTAGCVVHQEGAVVITPHGTYTIYSTAATHGASTPPTHAAVYALGAIVLAAAIGAIVWLIHNRGKLAALAASVATKV